MMGYNRKLNEVADVLDGLKNLAVIVGQFADLDGMYQIKIDALQCAMEKHSYMVLL